MGLARLLRIALAVATALLASSVASAQVDVASFPDLGLYARVEYAWPGSIDRGYVPVVIELENESDVGRDVEATAELHVWRGGDQRTTKRMRVEPRSKVRYEMFLASFSQNISSYQFKFEVGSSEERIGSSWTVSSWGPGAKRAILVLSDQTIPDARVAEWTTALSTNSQDLGGQTYYDVALAAIGPEQAPRRIEGYTSLHSILVDSGSVLPAESMESIVAWMRLGGLIVFSGPDAERRARATPGVAAWMEDRFHHESRSFDVYRAGHGSLIVGRGDAFLDDADLDELARLLAGHRGVVPDPNDRPSSIRDLPIPGVRDLPYRWFIALLIAFTILIGPINFAIVKGTGRPAWLLLTIPVLALLGAALILGYGIFYQGIEVKEASQSFTVLDQRTHRADTVLLRSYFAGVSPADALTPENGTVCLPMDESGERPFLMDQTLAPLLTGDFVPVRREATQLLLNERNARARVGFEEGPSGVRVVNGLTVPIERLVVRTADGRYFAKNADGAVPTGELATVAPGATVALDPMEELPEIDGWLPRPVDDRDLGWSDALPRGAYVARVSENPFADRAGIEPDIASGEHILLGVLDLSGEPTKDAEGGE